jgi:hypothetical protein
MATMCLEKHVELGKPLGMLLSQASAGETSGRSVVSTLQSTKCTSTFLTLVTFAFPEDGPLYPEFASLNICSMTTASQ